jgi:hypothetical protein
MKKQVCENCREEFTGRGNQKYCSTRCKSAVNNARMTNRDEEVKNMEQKIRKNRKILADLHSIFQNDEIPKIVIDKLQKLGYDETYNNGISPDTMTLRYLDYSLTELGNNNYLIQKWS